MTANGVLQLGLALGVLLACVRPLGWYMARVYARPSPGRLERVVYRLARIDPAREMTWQQYAGAVLAFGFVGVLAVYGVQRLQGMLPLNPEGFAAVSPDSAFNTAVSFATNTNWQGYAGESTMSDLTQMIALTVQNFASAAAGMAVLVALIRGFARRNADTGAVTECGGAAPPHPRRSAATSPPHGGGEVEDEAIGVPPRPHRVGERSATGAAGMPGEGVTPPTITAPAGTIGNFWVDLVRGAVYVLLPLSFLFAGVLVSQGVPQTVSAYHEVPLVEPTTDADGKPVATQRIAVGPVASQVAIKQLGTNGGGFFNTNSAHPLENPTPLSNLLQLVAILLIPAALCWTFGELVGDRRQGWAILAAMLVIFLPLLGVTVWAEHQPNPALAALGVDQTAGNLEGKEVRFGVPNSALWAVATTAASNGSVNAMHDSFTPLGGLVPLWLMQLGEVVFGGVGSGLYGMLVFALVAVFVAGLMVGRTPEYLGKKIGAFEIKMASLVILLPCAMALVGTAVGVTFEDGKKGVLNAGPHGFGEILYAYSSAANNNGSAFAGLSANTPFYNGTLGLAMLVGRFGVMLPVLAVAGSLARKKHVPAGPGTLPTHTPLFVFLLVAVVVVVGALSFFPALALGPVVEHLMMRS